MAALMAGQRLHIINCNQHTETSDFLGGYRPNRWEPWLSGIWAVIESITRNHCT
jgi:midasin (ATPase involved in ribosome maturation)